MYLTNISPFILASIAVLFEVVVCTKPCEKYYTAVLEREIKGDNGTTTVVTPVDSDTDLWNAIKILDIKEDIRHCILKFDCNKMEYLNNFPDEKDEGTEQKKDNNTDNINPVILHVSSSTHNNTSAKNEETSTVIQNKTASIENHKNSSIEINNLNNSKTNTEDDAGHVESTDKLNDDIAKKNISGNSEKIDGKNDTHVGTKNTDDKISSTKDPKPSTVINNLSNNNTNTENATGHVESTAKLNDDIAKKNISDNAEKIDGKNDTHVGINNIDDKGSSTKDSNRSTVKNATESISNTKSRPNIKEELRVPPEDDGPSNPTTSGRIQDKGNETNNSSYTTTILVTILATASCTVILMLAGSWLKTRLQSGSYKVPE